MCLIIQVKWNEISLDVIVGCVFVEVVFVDYVYGCISIGIFEMLVVFFLDVLWMYYGNLIIWDGLKVGVVGVIDVEIFKVFFDKVFVLLLDQGDLVILEDVEFLIGDQVFVVLDVLQILILFVLLGFKWGDLDYQVVFVMNYILGGGMFMFWFYQEVWEKCGFFYGVGIFLFFYDYIGFLVGFVVICVDWVDEIVSVIKVQLEWMVNEGLMVVEFDVVKCFFIGFYFLWFDSFGKIVWQLVVLQNIDLGMDYFDCCNDEIEVVMLEDVKWVVKCLIGLSELIVVLVGFDIKQN